MPIKVRHGLKYCPGQDPHSLQICGKVPDIIIIKLVYHEYHEQEKDSDRIKKMHEKRRSIGRRYPKQHHSYNIRDRMLHDTVIDLLHK